MNQGANALCTASTPDAVSLNQTACSPRGARRIKFDPVDRNTVYASFFARGIWRSRSNGDPGTWEQIMLPRGFVGLGGPTTERDEFDVVVLPSGETRMYAGAGGGNYSGTGANAARLRRNDAVRTTAAATVQTTWVDFQQFSFALLERIGHRRQCRVFYRRRHGGEFARGRFRLACLLDDVVGEIHGYKITRLSRWITSS